MRASPLSRRRRSLGTSSISAGTPLPSRPVHNYCLGAPATSRCCARRARIFFVVSPHETLSTFTAIAGIFVLVDGVIAVVFSIFGSGEGRGLLALLGALSAIAGLILVKKPFETLVVFTLIVGVWFVVAAVVRVVSALPRARPGAGTS